MEATYVAPFDSPSAEGQKHSGDFSHRGAHCLGQLGYCRADVFNVHGEDMWPGGNRQPGEPPGQQVHQDDRYTLKAPNGVEFSDIRGYETWPDVNVSQVEDGLKVIVANPTMIEAYQAGVPGNGKPFPDGSKIVKIEWSQKEDPESPYPVKVPNILKRVGFIEKDSKRFPETNGWGYAQFTYDPATAMFMPEETDPAFGKELCHACHVAVAAKDYIFTAYPLR